MKKIYEQPEIEVYNIKMNAFCNITSPTYPPISDGYANDGDAGARRRTFLDGVDEVDWDLGF